MMGDNKSMSLTFSENEKTLNSSYQLFSKVISARVGNVSLNNLKNPVVLKYKPLNKQVLYSFSIYLNEVPTKLAV